MTASANETLPVALIQARTSSSRLPGKTLMPLGGATVLDQVIRRARVLSSQVVVCTSTDPSDDPIADHCAEVGVICVRGPLDDLFARFRLALADPRVTRRPWFIRVTADCPLLSVQLGKSMIEATRAELDYITVRHDQLPRGLAVELVRRAVFESIDPAALDDAEREHVTLHLYDPPGRYACLHLSPPAALRHPQLRLTLDYQEDYTLLSALFSANPELDAEAAVRQLLQNPELARINRGCVQRAPRQEGRGPR